MTNKEKGFIWLSIALLCFLVVFAINFFIARTEIDKYEAILDVACDYSGNRYSCEQGVKTLKGMSAEDIKDFSPYKK